MTRARRRVTAAVLAALMLAPGGVVHATSERELGRRFILEARSQLPVVEDPAVNEYFSGLGQKLVETLGPQEFDYHFYTVAHPALNAFAVPGGYVFFFTGLIARAETDDELVGVLGHEISHIHAHHILRQQSAGTLWTAAALAGLLLSAVNPVLGAAGMAAAQTAQLKFSRDFEQEADLLGLRITAEAGYDPYALAAFFKQLLVEQRLNPTGVPPYMLSHPVTQDRVAHVDSIIKAQKLKTPPGRPAASPDFLEVRAVCQAIGETPGIVVERFKRLAAEKPDDPMRQFLLGRVYQTVGQWEPARVALERAREMGIGDRVDRPLGTVYLALKSPDKAKAALERRLAVRPNDAWARLEMGRALADSGNADGAIKEYQRAVKLDPDLAEAHRLLGVALGRKGDQTQGFYHLAVAFRLRGQLEQAFNHFERTEPMLKEGTPQRAEVEAALDELEPLVRERQRDRSQRPRTSGLAVLDRLERSRQPPPR